MSQDIIDENCLSVEAMVARNMGDADWEELEDELSYQLAGTHRNKTSEREKLGQFEAEPEYGHHVYQQRDEH